MIRYILPAILITLLGAWIICVPGCGGDDVTDPDRSAAGGEMEPDPYTPGPGTPDGGSGGTPPPTNGGTEPIPTPPPPPGDGGGGGTQPPPSNGGDDPITPPSPPPI
ncbi:MAG: hypothetical protein R6V19_10680 [Armatimonadota bacterium]